MRTAATISPRSGLFTPVAERLDVGGRSIAQPTVELRLVFEVLATLARYGDVPARQLGQGGHVTPEFFELRYREDVLLALTPALLDFLESDVCGHAPGHRPDCGCHFLFIQEIVPAEAEYGQELVDVQPARIRVVIRKPEFHILVRQRQALEDLQPAIHPGKPA